MSDILDRYDNVVKQLNSLLSKQERIAGKKEQILSDLKEKFTVSTIEEAEDLLEKFSTEHAVLENKLSTTLEQMEKIIEEA